MKISKALKSNYNYKNKFISEIFKKIKNQIILKYQ